MIISIPGEFYVYETDQQPAREELKVFFQELREEDILEVRIRSSATGEIEKIIHVAKLLLNYDFEFSDMSLRLSEDVFEQAARKCPYNLPIPVLDEDGNCVSILKKIKTYYDHYYHYEGGVDLEFVNRYDSIVLDKVNEYSIIIYTKVLPYWTGSEVFLIGEEWGEYIEVLPTLTNVNISILRQMDEVPAQQNTMRIPDLPDINGLERLTIIEGFQQNEDISRYKKGFLYYDEVMTITFMFSYVIQPGTGNPDKKFFLIDGFFRIEGIYGIWLKIFTAARYAVAKGYLPVFKIVSSDANIYSDYECDDIWDKFFLQPGDYSLKEVQKSKYLALSPNMNILNTLRYIMDEVSDGIQLFWPRGMYNTQVKHYLSQRRARYLPKPDRTLGVLLRGTDYVKTNLPGHAIHASVERVIDKIAEIEGEWDFDYIYLATEDEGICRKMKKYFGERIAFTDQERYITKPGQLLVELHQKKEMGKGFRLGVEYLCSIELLSSCKCLIASGSCGALGEALRLNGGRYKYTYVFHF